MPTREQMHSLVQEISGAHQARAAGNATRRQATSAWLSEVARGRNTQTKQLQKGLAQTASRRRAGVTGWLRAAARGRKAQAQQVQTGLRQGRADLAEMDGQRRVGVAAWLLNVTRVHASAQREWQKLARGMHPGSTNGAAPAVETSTGQRKAVGEATHELTALAGGVFQYLADRPDGAPLVEIEKEIQLDRFGAVRALKRLMDDGKAEKRGRLYFAA